MASPEPAMSEVAEHGVAIFEGPGEMRALCRAFDWSSTALGPVERWSTSLRTIVAMLLASRHPMFLFWGAEGIQFYNDAYRVSLGSGGRHPRALGMRAHEFWTDIWDTIGPQIEQVMSGGPATWHEDQYLPIERNGRLEDVYWTYSYSPVLDDDGKVGGTLVVCQETTKRVLGERVMHELSRQLEVERARLAYVFERAPTFLAVLRGERHVFERINGAFQQLVGNRKVVGLPLREALPELEGQGFRERLDSVLATGEPFIGHDVPVRLQREAGSAAEERFIDFVYQPLIEADGSRTGVIAHGSDVTGQVQARREVERLLEESERARLELTEVNARLRAQELELRDAGRRLAERTEASERAQRRTEALQALTASLAGARTLDDLSTAVVAEIVSVLGATTGAMAVRTPGASEPLLLRQVGVQPAAGPRVQRRSLHEQGPLAECLHTGSAVWLEHRAGPAGFDGRFPTLRGGWDDRGIESAAYVPLVVAGEAVGALAFEFSSQRRFGPDDRNFLLALGQQAAVAVERARLFEAERVAREEAETANQRVTFLAEVSGKLARTLDVEATLRTVAELAVPALADWCFVEVLSEGKVRAAAVSHVDPDKVALGYEVLRRYPVRLDAPYGTGHVLRTGAPELTSHISDEMLVAVAQDAEHLALLREVGFRSAVSVPMFSQEGRPVAAISLVSESRRFGPADLAMAEEVARRAGVALSSARLYEAEQSARRRATAVQRVTAALSGTLTVSQAARMVLQQAAATLGASAGVVLRTTSEGDAVAVIEAVGYPDDMIDPWRRVPLDANVPIADAARTRLPVFISSLAEWQQRYRTTGLLRTLPGMRSWAALPLIAESGMLGAMGLSFDRERAFSPEERGFALALAQQCAQAFERARLFEAERLARAEAERANRAKSEFLAVMSHELRTPLNAIGGYAELMELGIHGPVTPEQVSALSRIQTSQRHLLGLINGVLNYARVEAGHVNYDLRDVPLLEVLATCEALTTPQMRGKGLRFELTGCDETTMVVADREKVQQIVLNLLSNAVKFTDPGGGIAIRCAEEGDVVLVDVEDTGRGIASEELERVFQPFVQVDAKLTRTQEGVGLGLAISRDLARGMGGDLQARSEVGKGSTFTLSLRRAAGSAS